ncbi:MAG: zinc ABC transporter substrate-binding protein [Solirubrobacteraceae bacterium]
MLESLQLPFVQRGIAEILLLGIAAGLLGTWIVLRGLAFFAHAVSAASFPGLVLADGLSFSAHVGAGGSAGVVAAWVGWLARRGRDRYDVATALVLVGALSLGVVLASDVFASGANVETLLFGSLLIVNGADIAFAAVAAALVVLATVAVGARWLATGFDPGSARALGLRPDASDTVLLGLIGVVAIASLSAIGALLTTALMVVPAATTRLLFGRLVPWQLATIVLACCEGVAGLLISVELDVAPGPAIAVLAGAIFAFVAIVRALRARRALVAATALVVALGAGGCGADADGGGSKLDVVATTTQLGDVVRAIGGDAVDVHQILAPNSDPHAYEPRPGDVKATADAEVVVESGDGLDAWMDDIVEQSGSDAAVIVAGEHVVSSAPGDDPHWWHDPRNVVAVIPVLRDALIAADPSRRGAYELRARAYLARVRALDRGIARCFAAVPEARRQLVTDHDAFGYFARRYGIRVVGAVIPAAATQARPSAGAVAELIELVEREGVRAVFPESSASPDLARTIAERTGATAEYTLYGDTLGPAGSDGATYVTMESHNADAMVRGFTGGAVGCSIPQI